MTMGRAGSTAVLPRRRLAKRAARRAGPNDAALRQALEESMHADLRLYPLQEVANILTGDLLLLMPPPVWVSHAVDIGDKDRMAYALRLHASDPRVALAVAGYIERQSSDFRSAVAEWFQFYLAFEVTLLLARERVHVWGLRKKIVREVAERRNASERTIETGLSKYGKLLDAPARAYFEQSTITATNSDNAAVLSPGS